ncbi:MAG: protease inhibitor I42 family protein [Firmicutes bacterium]|nr:protease inhibitor I42 family protein [Bacillota bacterium]
MKWIVILILAGVLILAGYLLRGQILDGPGMVNSYKQIDQETAKQMIAADDSHIVVDVRRIDEYESGHIPGAICIPNESIEKEMPAELPNLNQIILIYCRSGNRSKEAAKKLFRMGYRNVYEFGGIIDWTGEVVTGQTLLLTAESNPTTGYSWQAVQDTELFDIRDIYTSVARKEPVSGAGGWQYFIFTPKQAGTAEVTFTYSRPWEANEHDRQFQFTFEVSEENGITVTKDGSADARGFDVTVKIY